MQQQSSRKKKKRPGESIAWDYYPLAFEIDFPKVQLELFALSSFLGFFFFFPSRIGWPKGKSFVVCLFVWVRLAGNAFLFLFPLPSRRRPRLVWYHSCCRILTLLTAVPYIYNPATPPQISRIHTSSLSLPPSPLSNYLFQPSQASCLLSSKQESSPQPPSTPPDSASVPQNQPYTRFYPVNTLRLFCRCIRYKRRPCLYHRPSRRMGGRGGERWWLWRRMGRDRREKGRGGGVEGGMCLVQAAIREL